MPETFEAQPSPAPERWEVWYEGHVQGVGFRYTARRLAAQFAVSGYVKNLPDGRVLLVMEGLPSQMDQLLQAIQSVMGRYIVKVTCQKGPFTGQFRGFEIRF